MIYFNSQFQFDTSVCYGDKSISHRALILSAIAGGESVLKNLSLCQDVLTTAECLRVLGAKIQLQGTTVKVTPIAKPCDNVTLDCQNSGTTARLLAGLVSGLGVTAKFVGDESLQKRPMDRVIQPLEKLGAKITKGENELFTVHPSKLVGKTILSQVNSAQVKSAILLAGLFADGKTCYAENLPTRNHTEILLSACGVDICNCAVAKSSPKPLNFTIPNDISSASFLLALALLSNQNLTLPNVGTNDGRVGFLTVLQNAGVNITLKNQREVCGEKVADICLQNGDFEPLFASQTEVVNAIDELPILCAIAIAKGGKHRFESVCELQYKESNRIQGICKMARACGQTATFDGQNLTIISNGILPKNPFFDSCDDHRLAMSQAVLSIACGGGAVDSFPADISFPNFLQAVGVQPKKFCVIGNNVTKSMSPKLAMYLASQAGVCCSYDALTLCDDVTDEQLLGVLSSYDGVNVTIPFKERVANLLGATLPSVNVVGKNLLPQSTDGYGAQMALLQNGMDVAGKSIWIVGAGGAAQAVIEYLQGKCQIQVVNRTQSKVDFLTKKYHLCKDISNPFGVLSFVPECDFEKSLTLPSSCKFAFISAYQGDSGLREQAQRKGIKVIDGLQMLYHQGAKSFSLWTNTPIQNHYQGFLDSLSKW